MDMRLIQEALAGVLTNVMLGILSLAGAYAVSCVHAGAEKLKAQTASIKDEEGRKLFEQALADVAGLADLSVKAMEQTTAGAVRELVKKGIKDRNELVALGDQVFREVKAAVGPRTCQVITDNLGDFDCYLKKCIEKSVLQVKRGGFSPLLSDGGTFDSGAVPR